MLLTRGGICKHVPSFARADVCHEVAMKMHSRFSEQEASPESCDIGGSLWAYLIFTSYRAFL